MLSAVVHSDHVSLAPQVYVHAGNSKGKVTRQNIQHGCTYTIHGIDRVLEPCNITALINKLEQSEGVRNQTLDIPPSTTPQKQPIHHANSPKP